MKLEQKTFSTFSLLFIAWIFISLLGGIEVFMIYLFRPDSIQSGKFYWLPLMRLVNGFAAITLVLIPGYRYLKNKKLILIIPGYFILMLCFILVYLLFSVGQFQFAFLQFNPDLFLAGIGETIMTDLHHIASYYFFLLFICLGKDYFDERSAALIRKEQAEKELNQTRLQVLQQQIQPHFLFNTLNSSIGIMEDRKEAAQEMLIDLGELLRASIALDFRQNIPLAEELEILSLYISIEQKRFEHQLDIRIEVESNTLDQKLPPFLLQPLVENAIKHGYKGAPPLLEIVINAHLDAKDLVLEIKNNGSPLGDLELGIGLRNVKDRLSSTYAEGASFKLAQEGKWVVNRIIIPQDDV